MANKPAIPVHDQSLTAVSKNYRRSVNAQILINAAHLTVIEAGHGHPGNRNDVVAARHTLAHSLDGTRGDPGRRRLSSIAAITNPRRGADGRIIHHDHYQRARRIRARVENIIARIKDWQILRQCRRRDQAINHSVQIVAGLWNLKACGRLRVNSSARGVR